MKRQFPIILALVTLLALFAVPSCTEQQLAQGDKIGRDVNDGGRLLRTLAESPEAAFIPPQVRVILELLGLGGAAAFGIWQKIRAAKILEKKQDVDVTLKAIVDAIDQAEPKASDPVKTQILATMIERRIHGTADQVVDEHRSKLATQ